MSNRCNDCKFHDWDYEWDEVDEEGHNEYVDSREECPFFQKFVKEPYVEKYTKCDKCKLLEECKEEGRLIEVTTEQDSSQHYIMGRGDPCKE